MALVVPFQSPLSPDIIEQAESCLQEGGVLVIPTDSYYALAVSVFQPAGLKKLHAIKGDRDHKPFPVLIGDLSQLDQLVEDVPEIAQKLMHQFWPGLLTLVLKAKPHLSASLVSDMGAIGVRQPNDTRVCELLRQTGPVTGTSANRSEQPPAQSTLEVQQNLGSEVDLILDGGVTPGAQPSTVLQVEPELRILRKGKIPLSMIQNIVEKKILLG